MLIQNIQEFLSSLSLIQNLAIFNISIGTLILNALITIITIFYSDFLIDYFRLESKYPRIAKFIRLRKMFQDFNILVNIIVIVIVLMFIFYVNFF